MCIYNTITKFQLQFTGHMKLCYVKINKTVLLLGSIFNLWDNRVNRIMKCSNTNFTDMWCWVNNQALTDAKDMTISLFFYVPLISLYKKVLVALGCILCSLIFSILCIIFHLIIQKIYVNKLLHLHCILAFIVELLYS